MGDGTTVRSTVPIKVMENVAAVYIEHSDEFWFNTIRALQTDGSLWVWGLRAGLDIGGQETTLVATPTKIMENVSQAAAGGSALYTIQTDGSLWVWGYGSRLLDEPMNATSPAYPATRICTPSAVALYG